jgi:hypothetical protein
MGAKMPATLVLNVRFRDRLTDWAMTALGRFDPSFTVPFHKQLKGRDNSPACDGVALHVPYWQLSAEYC